MARAKGIKAAITKASKRVVATTIGNNNNNNKNKIPIPTTTKPPIFAKDSKFGKRYWLIKSEPFSRIDPKTGQDAKFSIRSLFDKGDIGEPWDGVRNFEAKNNLLNMEINDYCLFYHSNCNEPGIVGIAEVISKPHPDDLQFDTSSNYYDSKSTIDNPRWWCPDVKFFGLLNKKIKLSYFKESDEFKEFMLIKRGRLSVIPVSYEHFYKIIDLQRINNKDDEKFFENEFDCDITNMNFIPNNFMK